MVLRSIFSCIALFSLCLLMSCDKDNAEVFDEAKQFQLELDAIDAYLEGNFIPHIKDPSGLRMVIKSLGDKLPAQPGSEVNVNYKGTIFATGEVFQEDVATGYLEGFIRGWQIGIRKLPVGTEATLYIPSYHAYGNAANRTIPANSTLVFDIKINSAAQSQVYKNRFTSDTTALNTFIANKQLTVVKDPSGIRYQHITDGTGPTPAWLSAVELKYSFFLLSDDQKVIGTYERKPIEGFNSLVTDFIQGMQVALQKMKEGGKMRVYIPSGLAFGSQSATDASNVIIIPANSNVIVDIELVDVK